MLKFLTELPTESEVVAFNNESYFGITVTFSEKNFGLGEITFSVNKETGEVEFDNEDMSLEHCGQILERSIGTEVISVLKYLGGEDDY